MRTLLILIIGSLVFGNCASDSSEATVRSAEVANPSPFGDLEGRMSWADAKKKCESKKMGLPTSDDFKNAVKMNYNASWTEKEQN
ncbi:MAG: hypothetical protein KDK36_08695, partial [Leptospiraceae bacterium]|nr:hypothetical protein [Leptospiraceae bacterium]